VERKPCAMRCMAMLLLLSLEVVSAENTWMHTGFNKPAATTATVSSTAPSPPAYPPIAPSTVSRCATGDTGEICSCDNGTIYYGVQYINELQTSNPEEWINATTIMMMISTGLAVGYSPRTTTKCWYEKGFMDIYNDERFGTTDPLPGIGPKNRQCFCLEYYSPSAPPPASPPLIPGAVPGQVTGDPHFRGGDGDRFDFAGVNNTVYSMLSTSRLALNALFVKMSFVMGGKKSEVEGDLKTVHGSAIKAVYFRALTAAGKTLTVEYKADEPSHAPLSVKGGGSVGMEKQTEVEVHTEKPDGTEYTVDDVKVLLTRKHKREAAITVSNGDFELKAASVYLAWAEKNKKRKRLDVSITPLRDVSASVVAPHGLIGQTFDGDGVAVDGATDDYSAYVVYTKAMGEGAIEGVASDYVIDRADPFSTAFKYSRFGASSAAPRDAAALTGLHRKVERPQLQSAGTNGDDEVTVRAYE